MKNVNQLVREFHQLKADLFVGAAFVVPVKNCAKWARYNQLFQFLYPQYRGANFVNPIS